MPSASSRAVTSAEEPAGNSTVISIRPFFGNGGSCACVTPMEIVSASAVSSFMADSFCRLIVGQNLSDFDAASFSRRHNPRPHDRQRTTCAFAAHLGRPLAADGGGEFFEF